MNKNGKYLSPTFYHSNFFPILQQNKVNKLNKSILTYFKIILDSMQDQGTLQFMISNLFQSISLFISTSSSSDKQIFASSAVNFIATYSSQDNPD